MQHACCKLNGKIVLGGILNSSFVKYLQMNSSHMHAHTVCMYTAYMKSSSFSIVMLLCTCFVERLQIHSFNQLKV